jgi:hypothetical protein
MNVENSKRISGGGRKDRAFEDALNAMLSLGALAMMIYGTARLGRNAKAARFRWFAIDIMVQVISVKIASDLIPHGIAVRGQNLMDAGVGIMLMAMLVVVLIGDFTGLSTTNPLWLLVDGAEIGLFMAVLVKYLTRVVV